MIDFKKFFTPDYLFTNSPWILSRGFLIGMAVAFGASLVLGVVSAVAGRKLTLERAWRTLAQRMGNLLITMGVLGYIYLFFRYERIYLLGARYWLLALGLIAIAWFVFIAREFLGARSRTSAPNKRYDEFLKYLPKKKT